MIDTADSILDEFEGDWKSGGKPEVSCYLKRAEQLESHTVLRVYLARLDIVYRISRGAVSVICDYLRGPLGVWFTRSQLLELLNLEYNERFRRGDRHGTALASYLRDFPELSDFIQNLKPEWECEQCGYLHNHLPGEDVTMASCIQCNVCFPVEELFSPDDLGLDHRTYVLNPEWQIGSGGMGKVYWVHDPALSRQLAIKVMREEFRGVYDYERRFKREARIMGQLQHPAIVPVHNFGRMQDGCSFFTMKLVLGDTLASILDRRRLLASPESTGPLSTNYLFNVYMQVCQALALAHKNRIIHRDLKPSNVMVGEFGVAQVMDWGLAKHHEAAESNSCTMTIGTTETESGLRIGTPHYMSPEQYRLDHSRVGPASDVFALGAMLCEILTGRPPYWHIDEVWYETAMVAAEKTGRLREANARVFEVWTTRWADHDVRPGLERLDKLPDRDRELADVCGDCLAIDRAVRPADAGQLVQRLEKYQDNMRRRAEESLMMRALAASSEKRAIAERIAGRRAYWFAVSALLLAVLCIFALGMAILSCLGDAPRAQLK